jgi:hypothetical protein
MKMIVDVEIIVNLTEKRKDVVDPPGLVVLLDPLVLLESEQLEKGVPLVPL